MDLLSCSKVNKEWCEFARSERVWKRHKDRVLRYFKLEHLFLQEVWNVFVQDLLPNPILKFVKTDCYVLDSVEISSYRVNVYRHTYPMMFKNSGEIIFHITNGNTLVYDRLSYYIPKLYNYKEGFDGVFTIQHIYLPYLCIVNDDMLLYHESVLKFIAYFDEKFK